jgi:hypothetical protein
MASLASLLPVECGQWPAVEKPWTSSSDRHLSLTGQELILTFNRLTASLLTLYIYLNVNPTNHFVGLTEDHFLSQVYSFFLLSFLSVSPSAIEYLMNYFVGLTEDRFHSQIK